MGLGSLRRFHGGRDAYLPNLDDRVGEDPRGILDKNHREEFDQPYGEAEARDRAARERKEKGDEPLDPKEEKRRKAAARKTGDRREPDQTKALDKAASEGNLPDGDRRAPVRPEAEINAEMRAAPSQTLPPNNPDMNNSNSEGSSSGTPSQPSGPEGGTRATPPGTNPAPGTAAPTPGSPAPAAPGSSPVTPPKAPANAPKTRGGRKTTGGGKK
jgi:hypothetical protein